MGADFLRSLPVNAIRRERDARDDTPPPPRKDPASPEAIGFWASAGGVAWATFSELLPILPKTVGSAGLAAIAAWGAFKAWQAKNRD